MKHLVLLPALTGTLFLAGCGLEPREDDDDKDSVSIDYSQNVTLPLTDSTSLEYTNDIRIDVAKTSDLSADSAPIYALSVYQTAISPDKPLTVLFVSSTASGIFLHSLTTAFGDSPPFPDVDLMSEQSYTITNADGSESTLSIEAPATTTTAFTDDSLGLDELPTTNLALTYGTTNIEMRLTDGLGIVGADIAYNTTSYESELSGLIGLPEPLVYTVSSSTDPSPVGNSYFTLGDSGDRVGTDSYTLVNETELDTYDYLSYTVATDNSYTFTVLNDDTLPEVTEVIPVRFSDNNATNRVLSGVIVLNVTD